VDFALSDEHRMLKDLVQNFVRDELTPLEGVVMQREATGQGADRLQLAGPQELLGLRLHLLTHSPAPFRRRNIFIDASVGARV